MFLTLLLSFYISWFISSRNKVQLLFMFYNTAKLSFEKSDSATSASAKYKPMLINLLFS